MGGDERELREAGVETNHGLFSPPLHGRECSHTALTSHPNPPQLKDPLSQHPHYKDQQPLLEQLGHHHGNQTRPSQGWRGAALKSFIAPKQGLILSYW